jgi:hypothetical protein
VIYTTARLSYSLSSPPNRNGAQQVCTTHGQSRTSFGPATKCVAYSSEPELVLSGKQNISTKQSAYQNIHIILRPHFVQNKYAPHTKNSRYPRDQQRPQRGHAPQFGNLFSTSLNANRSRRCQTGTVHRCANTRGVPAGTLTAVFLLNQPCY